MQAKVNILLVDDRLSNLIALEAMLDMMGQNLIRANSGAEALLQLLERDFALILLDVQMGGMDGFETADLIKQRERTKTTPIIFITAIHRDTQNLYKGYSTGAVDYLFKPLVPDILRAKVGVFVDLYQKNQEIVQKSVALEAVNRELKQQLNKVHILNRKLEAMNFELESFGYSVSHDLRAPLRSIKGFSQALVRGYSTALDGEGQDYLNRIISSVDFMGNLIDDLLQLSQVIRGKLEMQPFSFTELARNVVEELQQTYPNRKVKVDVEDGLMAYGDVRLLRLALWNLADNAWKFTRHTSNPHIVIGCEMQSRHRVFYVHDNGAGFDMLYRDQLFQPFQRLHPQDEFEGNGVGLSTVQRIIQRHGGEIWAIGEVGNGATFYFTLMEIQEPTDE